MIQLRFVTDDSPFSYAIRAAQRDCWASHVEAIMPDGTWLGAHMDGGVQARPADYDKATRTRVQVVELWGGAIVEEAFHGFLIGQIGKPYDLAAIAAFPFGRDWRSPDSWFCSELIAAALEESKFLPRLAVPDNHISPRDLLLVLSGRVPIPSTPILAKETVNA